MMRGWIRITWKCPPAGVLRLDYRWTFNLKIMISLKKIIGLGLIFYCTVACEKYLAEKPSSSIAIPSTVGDFQALMDYQARMNDYYPDCGDIAADYFYLQPEYWINSEEHTSELQSQMRNSYAVF